MLLAIDIGNTNISIAIFNQETIIQRRHVATEMERTKHKYEIFFTALLEQSNIGRSSIDGVIITSVVPQVMHSFTAFIKDFFHLEPIIVDVTILSGITVRIDNPEQLGADRLVDAAGAFFYYGGNTIIVNFGTATTFDYVDHEGGFLGGVIAPGMETMSKALVSSTAKLPAFDITQRDTVIGKNTIDSMQSGVFYGYIGLSEHIIKEMMQELETKPKVIATGGLGKMLYDHTDIFDIYDPDLTFKGLKLLYDKNKKM